MPKKINIITDTRSLAFYRILVGSLVLLVDRDLCQRFFFYEAGMLPLEDFPRFIWLNPIEVTSLAKLLLYVIIPITSILLILGCWSRYSASICYLSLYAVQSFNPEILQGGDVLLRLLLFWLIFLPNPGKLSFDSHGGTTELGLWTTAQVALIGYTLQVCSVYWFAALLKTGSLWNESGNALFYAMSLEHFTTPFGLSLRKYPELLRCLTFFTRIFEFAGPCLLLLPYPQIRFLGVILFCGFHLVGMQALLRIGFYPFICAVALAPFIPSCFWDWFCTKKQAALETQLQSKWEIERKLENVTKSTRILGYLGCAVIIVVVCDITAWNLAGLSNRGYRFMQRWDYFGTFCGLEQHWDMYAPFPKAVHGWIIVPANLADGSQMDLFTRRAVTYAKPENIADYLGDFRWRRYVSNLFDTRDQALLSQYSNFLVNKWNQSHHRDQRVEDVSIIFMEERTMPDLTISEPEQKVLYFSSY